MLSESTSPPVAEQLSVVDVVIPLPGLMTTELRLGDRLLMTRSEFEVSVPPVGSVTVTEQRTVSVEVVELEDNVTV